MSSKRQPIPTLRGGRALITTALVLALVVGLGRLAATMYVEILWHAQTGYGDVFWLRVLWQWGARIVAGVAVGVLVFLNLRIVAETLGGLGLLLGALTPLAACAVLSAMLCAWAVNVSAAAFWSEPFNVPFLIGIGAAALLFTGAGRFSLDAGPLARITWSMPVRLGLVGLAVIAAVVTWVALYGVNPIHLTTPSS